MGRAVNRDLPGPVMVASGCGGTGRELRAFVDLVGLDFATRSITLDARTGGLGPRLVEVPGGVVHAGGLPNPGLDHFLATELPWLVRAGARVFVSIAGATIGEYADLARRLSSAPGVAGIEVNLGAPDELSSGLFEVREPYHAASVIAAVRREIPADRPVLAKIRPDVSRVVEGARLCQEAGATAVVVGSPLPAALPDGREAGLGGPAVAPVVWRCVVEVRSALPDVPLIACGGVHDVASARRFLDAGAVAVQLGTALLHDPTTLARLRAQLQEDE